ncbi:MAG: hypothetical protein ACOCXA_02630 [Planctomycetota bacterium]
MIEADRVCGIVRQVVQVESHSWFLRQRELVTVGRIRWEDRLPGQAIARQSVEQLLEMFVPVVGAALHRQFV